MLILYIVHLPNLRSKPSFASLYEILESLVLQPNSWTGSPKSQDSEELDVEVVNRYLLSVISSELAWFEDESKEEVVLQRRDDIWELASKRMAERCGRNGASMLFITSSHVTSFFILTVLL